MLGPLEVFFLSVDDKARVPMGITAANKQAPMLVHMEFNSDRVSLPDHDWVIAEKHKLVPSVYAGIVIKEGGLGDPSAVGYSGPTFIAVRSAKHSSSNPYSHAFDFQRLLELSDFESVAKNPTDKSVKPVLIVTCDGGPDENPRYQKVIDCFIHHFLVHDLDACFVATNAPGRSAYNRVERRMSHLSRPLAGMILQHDHYGSHLDERGQTVDPELEKQNFGYAALALCKEWSGLVIDGYNCVAESISPDASELKASELKSKDQFWFSTHVRTSQYMLQVVKCRDETCCGKPRSSYFSLFPDRFLPPPIPISQTTDGLKVPDRTSFEKHRFPSSLLSRSFKLSDLLPKSTNVFKGELPYDLYCPSVQTELIERRCKNCNLYFASKVMVKNHHAVHKKTAAASIVEPIVRQVRPVRIAARRQRELMAIIARKENETDIEVAEWIDESLLDLNGVPDPTTREGNQSTSLPIISVQDNIERNATWEIIEGMRPRRL